jgi:hypothetical protein
MNSPVTNAFPRAAFSPAKQITIQRCFARISGQSAGMLPVEWATLLVRHVNRRGEPGFLLRLSAILVDSRAGGAPAESFEVGISMVSCRSTDASPSPPINMVKTRLCNGNRRWDVNLSMSDRRHQKFQTVCPTLPQTPQTDDRPTEQVVATLGNELGRCTHGKTSSIGTSAAFNTELRAVRLTSICQF